MGLRRVDPPTSSYTRKTLGNVRLYLDDLERICDVLEGVGVGDDAEVTIQLRRSSPPVFRKDRGYAVEADDVDDIVAAGRRELRWMKLAQSRPDISVILGRREATLHLSRRGLYGEDPEVVDESGRQIEAIVQRGRTWLCTDPRDAVPLVGWTALLIGSWVLAWLAEDGIAWGWALFGGLAGGNVAMALWHQLVAGTAVIVPRRRVDEWERSHARRLTVGVAIGSTLGGAVLVLY